MKFLGVKQLERRLGIEINRRYNTFKLVDKPLCIDAAASILTSLYVDTAPLRRVIADIETEQIHLAIKQSWVLEQIAESMPNYGLAVNIQTKRGIIKPRTPNQAQYIAHIINNDITFGVAPAGTGKTYLAVAATLEALERQEIRRILWLCLRKVWLWAKLIMISSEDGYKSWTQFSSIAEFPSFPALIMSSWSR